ncbi:MAG: hypothetical protein ACKOE6_03460, partial [Flammeovirgaceae bacterium]
NPDGMVDTRRVVSFLLVLKMKALATPNTQLVSIDRAVSGKIRSLFLKGFTVESFLESGVEISVCANKTEGAIKKAKTRDKRVFMSNSTTIGVQISTFRDTKKASHYREAR